MVPVLGFQQVLVLWLGRIGTVSYFVDIVVLVVSVFEFMLKTMAFP